MQHNKNDDYIHISPDRKMIEAQARIISDLNLKVSRFDSQLESINKQCLKYKAEAEMYRDIVAFVQEHAILQGIWDELVTAMRLIDPDKFR